MADGDDELLERFLDEARDRARFRNPDNDASLPLVGGALAWKTIVILLMLAWYFAP